MIMCERCSFGRNICLAKFSEGGCNWRRGNGRTLRGKRLTSVVQGQVLAIKIGVTFVLTQSSRLKWKERSMESWELKKNLSNMFNPI